MKALVTGGAGFIGSHLAERLVELGHNVIVIDNLSVSDCNIPLLKKLGVDIKICDISKFDEIKGFFKGCDIVFHLAAMNRAQRSIENPLLANEYNITGTLNVLEASKNAQVSKVINISSSSVYGAVRERLLSEDMALYPCHPYGVSKLAGEHYTRIYYELYGLQCVTLRYFSVYGPRQLGHIDKAGVIAKFIHCAFSDKPITIYGTGEQKRNFTYVSDVVSLTIKAAETDAAIGKVINIANPNEVSINYLVEVIKGILKKPLKIEYLPPISSDPPRNPADISMLSKILKSSLKIDFEEGIKKTIDWYKETFK